MDLESDIDTLLECLNGQEIPGVKQAEWTSGSCLCHPAEGLGTPSSFQNKLEKERSNRNSIEVESTDTE